VTDDIRYKAEYFLGGDGRLLPSHIMSWSYLCLVLTGSKTLHYVTSHQDHITRDHWVLHVHSLDRFWKQSEGGAKGWHLTLSGKLTPRRGRAY